MADTKVLKAGTGVPYLAIFDGNRQPIIDPKSGLPIGMFMVSFDYEYDEDKVNSAEFMLETDNPDLIMHPALDYQMPIRLQWGWIHPDGTASVSKVRSLIVTNHKLKMGRDKVEIKVECKDASILLQQQPAKYFQESEDYRDWLVNLLNGRVGIKLLDYEKKSVINHRVAQRNIP